MAQGFYELLGVSSTASTEEIRSAFGRVVAGLIRRRRAILEQGGDVSRLDLAEAKVHEAWGVLSDPSRRRRYDAMVHFADRGLPESDDALWQQVAGAMINPAVASAFELVDAITDLRLGTLPSIAGMGQTRAPSPPLAGETTVTERIPRTNPTVAPVPEDSRPDLKVVEGRPQASPVIVLPDPPRRRRTGRTIEHAELQQLLDQHGFSGALLRAARELQGFDLQEVGNTTRIAVRYLEALEQDARDHLPSATFVRGYVRELARLLGLPEAQVVEGYMNRLSQQ